MSDFFDSLSRRGHDKRLEKVSGTVRFDISDGERTDSRLARIDHGDITVSAGDAPADCVVTVERAVFDAIVEGRANAMTALLRGSLAVDGDPELFVLTQRLFAEPADPAAATSAAGGRGSS